MLLVGNNNLESGTDDYPLGYAGLYRMQAVASGTADQMQMYFHSTTDASNAFLGVYADSAGVPGARLWVSGNLVPPTPGQWNVVAVSPGLEIVQNTYYWLGFLNPTGGSGGCVCRIGSTSVTMQVKSALAALPDPWGTSAPGSELGPLSIYLEQIGGGPSTQKLRPDADVADGGWTTTPLWSKIDEESAGGDVITATAS